MKKFFLFSFLIVISVSSQAQNQKLGIGFAANPGLSWLHADAASMHSKNKISFGYGVNIDYWFQDNYALGTGFFVNYRGGVLQFDSTVHFSSLDSTYAGNSSMSYNIQYLSVPLTLKLSTNEIGYSKYYGKLGVDLNVNVKPRGEFTSKTGDVTSKIDLGKDVNPMDIGLYAALGMGYNVTQNVYINTELFFHNGFMDQLKFADGYDTKVILNNIGLQVGVQF